jgi:hypothetical protein
VAHCLTQKGPFFAILRRFFCLFDNGHPVNKIDQIEHSLHNLTSPKRGHTFWGLIAVLILVAAMLWAKHGVWLADPIANILNDTPDGFKNYMTTAWHVSHDSSYVHYEGMNYPYGEHVLFTDNQPILSAAMQWWSRHVSDLRGQTVGLMNVLQVLSMLFGAGVIFLLLRKLHLPVWYAGLVTIGILFLSPQYNRFDKHFGLSHTWIIPLLLLLLCRYEERHSRRYESLLIGILLFVAAQLHFYNFGVSAMFLGLYTLYQVLTDFRWKNIAKRFYHLVVMVLVPFALLNVWIHWSDYCPDRPANPYGFTTYIGYWEGIFLPYEDFPLYQWIDQNIIAIRRIDSESQAYIGMVAFAFTLWVLFRRRFRIFEPSWEAAAYHRVHKRYLYGIFAASFALVLFGCGVPFAIPGLEWLADYLGPIRQFRGLGRFTWVYYYTANILVFYILWNKSARSPVLSRWSVELNALWSKVRRRDFRNLELSNIRKWSLLVIPIIVICWEARIFQHNRPLHLAPNLAIRNVAAPTPDHWLNKVDFSQYQALMPLPYYHIGSENIWLDLYYPLYKKMQYTALLTGVPDMGVNMSRSAIGRMVKSMQWALPPCESPALLGDLPNNRPIALMIEPAKWAEVQQHYGHLISKATMVYDGPDMKIMSLVPDNVRLYALEFRDAVAREMNQPNLVPLHDGWLGTNPDKGWFVHQNFDSCTSSKYVFQGKGAGFGSQGDSSWIWNNPIPKGEYTLSLWIKVTEDMGMTQELKIAQNSLADGHQIHFRHEGLRFYISTIVDGWALFDLHFSVYEDNSKTQIFLHKKGANAPFWFDEVMIKPANTTVYRQTPGWIVRDNQWYRL